MFDGRSRVVGVRGVQAPAAFFQALAAFLQALAAFLLPPSAFFQAPALGLDSENLVKPQVSPASTRRARPPARP